jgi:hypothetical protein
MAVADYALVVGINTYPGLTSLEGAENDARDFYAWVTSPNGGKVDKVNATPLVSSDFAPSTTAENAKPATQEIEAFFTKIDDAAEANNKAGLGLKAGNRLWLFFSGHGFAPSLDRSAVLLANATANRVHNVAAMLWADRLYEGGWFDEIFLFQDACRSPITGGDLILPFLRKRSAPLGQQRKRFYAFSAKNRQISKELPVDARVRGVFTATLIDALSGNARDPVTGRLTTAQLKAYLQDNMRKLLSSADLADDEVAKMPEILDPDPFEILPAAPQPVAKFPVTIAISRPGPPAHIEDSTFTTIISVDPSPGSWQNALPRGLYKVVVKGLGEKLFQVSGPAPGGVAEVINVAV